MEQNLDEGFMVVRTEANKVLDVVASNKESLSSGFDKLMDETKGEWDTTLTGHGRPIIDPPFQLSTTT